MGLDMYLTAESYLHTSEWMTEGKPEVVRQVQSLRALYPEMAEAPLIKVGFTVAQWRKANHIHKWFVDNVQNGTDDCGQYSVSREQLQELLSIINRVLARSSLVPGDVSQGYSYDDKGNKAHTFKPGQIIKDPSTAKKLLPVCEGFFFGGTDYDEYYYETLIYTQQIIEKCLAMGKEWWFEYSSSW